MAKTSTIGEPVNFRCIDGTCHFRSSQPEGATTSGVFRSAGVRTIVDLRDISEVRASTLCADFRLCTVTPRLTPDGVVPQLKPDNTTPGKSHDNPNPSGVYAGVHAVIPLIDYKKLVKAAPLVLRIIIILAHIIDKVFGTRFARKLTISWVLDKGDGGSLLWLYKHIIEVSGDRVCTALHLFADTNNAPALVMCAMGKDRTGVISMLIGHICGRTHAQLITDYAVSQERFGSQPDHFLIKGVARMKLPRSYVDAPAETMEQLLDHVNLKYGSIDNYLQKIGFGAEYQAKLRQNSLRKN